MAIELQGYENDGSGESTVFLATTGDPPVLVTRFARVRIRGGNKIDGQTSGGTNKARVKFKGMKLSRYLVSFIVLPDDEARFWEEVFLFFRMPGDKGRALPLEVTNDPINRSGTPTITIEDYEIGEADPVYGREVILELREWSAAVFDPKPDPNSGKNKKQPPGPLDPEANAKANTRGTTPRPS